MKIKKNLIVVLLIFVSNLVTAQFNNLKFENLDTSDGLSSSTCVEIFQDSEGYLWFGTIDGLNKYNGYEFEVFKSVLKDSTSLSNNRVNSITEDNQGNLWVGTTNGLNLFNKQSNNFTQINLYNNLSLANSSQKMINDLLYDDQSNILWVATNNGLIKIALGDDSCNKENFKFSYYINDQTNHKSIDNNIINVILKDEKDKIWIGTNGEHLNRYNPRKDNFDRVFIDKKKPYELNHKPKKVFIDADGDFWIGNDLSNMLLWNKKENNFKHVTLVPESIAIHDFFQDKEGLFWVSTDAFGMYVFEKNEYGIVLKQHLENNFSDSFSLPNNKPAKIFEDKKGIYWIGSYDKGVSMLDPTNYLFGHYYYQPNNTNGLNEKIIQSVLQDSKERIWVSAYNGGLNLFDEKTESFKPYGTNAYTQNKLSSTRILYTFESSDGNIWVCTLDGGLNKFNPEKNSFKTYLHDVNDSKSIGQSSVWTGVEDNEKRIWFGLRTEGISLYDPKTENFKNYKNNLINENSLVSNSVLCSFIDSKNRLHIGTSLGLNVLNLNELEDYIPEYIEFDLIKEESLEGAGINYITEDHLGNIWVGSDYGVSKLNTELNLVKSYTSIDGLPNNLVVGIVEDNNRNIWITTKSGLSLLKPETHQFKNFNTHDGIQGAEFQSKSITKTKNGRIIVGGINGFNIFQPNDIKLPKVEPLETRITKFKINNKTVIPGKFVNGRILLNRRIFEVKDISLKHDENYISFEFVALHFDNSEQVQYAYRMKGLDNEFINIGTNRVVNLSNLEYGDYVFEVKASTNDDWSTAETAFIAIEITPPLWKRWWAYIFYFLIWSLIFWTIIRYYTLKVQEAQQHDLDQKQLQFFVNVSHEFRTPLTLILNPVDKILSGLYESKPETIKSSAVSIQRSARRLLHLVNQLLDYRKMDVGMAPLRLERGDVVSFSEDIFNLFIALANKKAIEYKINIPSEEIVSLFDFDKIEKIVTNLISNAIKYTNPEGKIVFSIKEIKPVGVHTKNKLFLKKNTLSNYLEIRVEDSGVGLTKEQMQNVFSRFYNVDITKTGTGIGLNFTKGLVEIHGGEIFVESELGVGSTFVVHLPLDIKAEPEKIENIKDEFLINSMKSIEYDMLIADEDIDEDIDVEIESEIDKSVILIVEDNKELRTHLVNDLESNYNVREAANGEKGLKLARKYYPDIIISDVMMPKMDGFELCRKVKEEFETSHIPVLLLTAKSLEDDRITGYHSGADGYLSKPFATNVLKARISNLLESRKRLRQRFSEVGGILPFREVTTNNIDEAFLDKATKIVLDSIDDMDFKQEHLLTKMGIGRSQLYRKISALTGKNPSCFIRTIRLRYASELLLKNQYSIKEVSYMTGFNSTAYFSKTFRELFKVTPTEYIEQNGKIKEGLLD